MIEFHASRNRAAHDLIDQRVNTVLLLGNGDLAVTDAIRCARPQLRIRVRQLDRRHRHQLVRVLELGDQIDDQMLASG